MKNILEANRVIRIPISIAVAVTRSDNADKALAALGDSLLGVSVTKFPVQAVGEGSNLDPADIIRPVSRIENLRCPGFEPTFHFDGSVYPCCSPTVFETQLSVGSIDEYSVHEALDAISRNILLAALRQKGLSWIVESCRIDGVDLGVGDGPFVDACEVCHSIFSRPDNLARVAGVIRAARTAGLLGN